MSSKQLVRLAAALGLLVIVWGVLALVRRPPEDKSVSLAIPRVDTAAVDTMVLTKARDTAVITRSGKQWSTNGFPADSQSVAMLLAALADTAHPTELVAQNSSSHERLGVTGDSALHAVVHTRGTTKPALDLIAGSRTGDYGGVFVRRNGDDAVYTLRGGLFDAFTRSLDDWRDKRIASVVADSVAAIEVHHGGRGYTLKRSGKAWTLSSGKPADSSAVSNLLGDYRDLRASGFPARAQGDSLDFAHPTASARLLSKAGKPLAELALDSTAGGMWARASSNPAVFKLDTWIWGQLVPAESTLVAKPKKK